MFCSFSFKKGPWGISEDILCNFFSSTHTVHNMLKMLMITKLHSVELKHIYMNA